MRFPKGELEAYGRSYHQAAQQLVRHVASTHYRDSDACPIVFLYRHAIELYLKAIIHWGNALLRLNGKATVAPKNIFREHRLRVLLKSVKHILRFRGGLHNWDHPHLSSFQDAEKLIGQLDDFDPGSYSFRYPVDTTGSRATLPQHFCFNIVVFGERFDRLLSLLEGISVMVYEEFQSESEALSAFQRG